MEETKNEKKQKSSEKYVVQEIATQTQAVILDTETKTQYDLYSAIVKILNDVEKIKSSTVG